MRPSLLECLLLTVLDELIHKDADASGRDHYGQHVDQYYHWVHQPFARLLIHDQQAHKRPRRKHENLEQPLVVHVIYQAPSLHLHQLVYDLQRVLELAYGALPNVAADVVFKLVVEDLQLIPLIHHLGVLVMLVETQITLRKLADHLSADPCGPQINFRLIHHHIAYIGQTVSYLSRAIFVLQTDAPPNIFLVVEDHYPVFCFFFLFKRKLVVAVVHWGARWAHYVPGHVESVAQVHVVFDKAADEARCLLKKLRLWEGVAPRRLLEDFVAGLALVLLGVLRVLIRVAEGAVVVAGVRVASGLGAVVL